MCNYIKVKIRIGGPRILAAIKFKTFSLRIYCLETYIQVSKIVILRLCCTGVTLNGSHKGRVIPIIGLCGLEGG